MRKKISLVVLLFIGLLVSMLLLTSCGRGNYTNESSHLISVALDGVVE